MNNCILHEEKVPDESENTQEKEDLDYEEKVPDESENTEEKEDLDYEEKVPDESENTQEKKLDDFVFVFCGGKCGTSTLFQTFKNNGYDTLVTHGLEYYNNHLRSENSRSITEILEDTSNEYKNVYFFDSYRTPIERKISSFFQNIHLTFPNYNELSTDYLINYFDKNLLKDIEEVHPIDEMLTYYNVPLFKTFDFSKGYNIITQKCSNGTNKIFVKLLFKDIHIWDKILTEIMGKQIILYNENLSKNKNYYKLYNEFKKKYKVPKWYIDNYLINDINFKIYNNKKDQDEYIKKHSSNC